MATKSRVKIALPPGKWGFHNTSSQNLASILREGLECGSFADKPIDFGRDAWIAVRVEDLGEYSTHEYGRGVTAFEPHWQIGTSREGYPVYRRIVPDKLVVVDRRGRPRPRPNGDL